MRQVTHLAGCNLAAVITNTAVFLMTGDEYDESVLPEVVHRTRGEFSSNLYSYPTPSPFLPNIVSSKVTRTSEICQSGIFIS